MRFLSHGSRSGSKELGKTWSWASQDLKCRNGRASTFNPSLGWHRSHYNFSYHFLPLCVCHLHSSLSTPYNLFFSSAWLYNISVLSSEAKHIISFTLPAVCRHPFISFHYFPEDKGYAQVFNCVLNFIMEFPFSQNVTIYNWFGKVSAIKNTTEVLIGWYDAF